MCPGLRMGCRPLVYIGYINAGRGGNLKVISISGRWRRQEKKNRKPA